MDELTVIGNGVINPSEIEDDESDHDSFMKMVKERISASERLRNENKSLEEEIRELRIKIRGDEEIFQQLQEALINARDSELEKNEEELAEVRTSLRKLDDLSLQLSNKNEAKDKIIDNNYSEINNLNLLIKKNNELARKMRRQVQLITKEIQKLESQPMYTQQTEELKRLKKEVAKLRVRVAEVEQATEQASQITQDKKIEATAEQRDIAKKQYTENQKKFSDRNEREMKALQLETMQKTKESERVMQKNSELIKSFSDVASKLSAMSNYAQPTNVAPKPGTSAYSSYERPIKQQNYKNKPDLKIVPNLFLGHSEQNADTPDVSSRTERSQHRPNHALPKSQRERKYEPLYIFRVKHAKTLQNRLKQNPLPPIDK